MSLLIAFALRWITTSFGLWVAMQLIGSGTAVSGDGSAYSVYLVAGLILSIVNIFIKPVVSIFSLPITILTLGLFTVIINGLMVYIALQLTPGLSISFWGAVLAGIIIGIVNYAINSTIETMKVLK